MSKRTKMTHEVFLERVKTIHGEKIIVVGSYINYTTKVELLCPTCKRTWFSKPGNTLMGKGCKNCNKKSRPKRTDEEFRNAINEIHGGKISVIGEYINSQEPVEVHCVECGNRWDAYPTNILNNKKGCKKCSDKKIGESRRKSHEEFVEDVYQKFGDGLEILGVYTHQGEEIEVRCTSCGNKTHRTPKNILKATTPCYECAKILIGESQRKSHEDFVEEMAIKLPNLKILGEYRTNKDKIKYQCLECGHVNEAKPENLLGKYTNGCPKCTKQNITHEEFVQDMKKVNDKILILSEYKNNKTKVRCMCLNCNHEWPAQPKNLKTGYGCPKCLYKKEKEVDDYLMLFYETFDRNVTFEGLVGVGGGLLSYDFGLKNDSKYYLIEYNGRQHYEPVRFGGISEEEAIENFETQQKHDQSKKKYAKDNGYIFVEIPYYRDYKKVLSEFGLCEHKKK